METRVCCTCGVEFPLDSDHFYTKGANGDGLDYRCKACRLKYQKDRRARGLGYYNSAAYKRGIPESGTPSLKPQAPSPGVDYVYHYNELRKEYRQLEVDAKNLLDSNKEMLRDIKRFQYHTEDQIIASMQEEINGLRAEVTGLKYRLKSKKTLPRRHGVHGAEIHLTAGLVPAGSLNEGENNNAKRQDGPPDKRGGSGCDLGDERAVGIRAAQSRDTAGDAVHSGGPVGSVGGGDSGV